MHNQQYSRFFALFLSVFLLLPSTLAGQEEEHGPPTLGIGSSAPDFCLKGVDGNKHCLKDYASAKVLMIAFICNHCPYVKAITSCKVVQRDVDRLVREVVLHGETLQELILFFPNDRVEFVRLSGHAKGLIKNIMEEDANGNLFLRFTFDIVLEGVAPGSANEQEFAAGMEAAYLDAVRTTLLRMREEAAATA